MMKQLKQICKTEAISVDHMCDNLLIKIPNYWVCEPSGVIIFKPQYNNSKEDRNSKETAETSI